jgi:hypothetical protein
MYHTTGLTENQIQGLCVLIHPIDPMPAKPTGRRHKLGLFKRIQITATYLRRNWRQWELAEVFGVDQATISRIVCAYTPLLAALLAPLVPTVDDLDPEEQLIVDGTLLPCWSWADHPEDWSGKAGTTGLNVQTACSLDGDLRWVLDPYPGATHDAVALRRSGLLDTPDPVQHTGDKGYIGHGLITLMRKPPGGELARSDHEYNAAVSSIRYKIERVIANLKTWRILHTDYGRPHHTHPETIIAVLGLESYRKSFA